MRGWLDYDRSKLRSLTDNERIDYFERRVRLVLLNPLRRLLATEIVVHGEESSALLIFGVSVCCGIEAAGKFLAGGRGGNGQRFDAFVKRYMAVEFQCEKVCGLTYGDALREHFRNGLAHGFAVRHGGFEGVAEQPYFAVREIAGTDALEINPTRLFEDFAEAFDKYLKDLRTALPTDPIFVDFNRVFEAVFIRGE